MDILIVFVLLNVGFVHACLNDPQCAHIYSQALSARAANNLTHSCLLESKSIACYSSGIPTDGCSETDAAAFRQAKMVAYVTACSVNPSDVAACQSLVSGCTSHVLDAVDPLSNGNITGYCSVMATFASCLDTQMAGCNPKVTKYDVAGYTMISHENICSSGGTNVYECTMKIQQNCYDTLTNATLGDTGDIPEYCQHFVDFLECFNDTVATCEASLDRTELMGGMDASYNLYCLGQAPPGSSLYEACQFKMSPCHLEYAATNPGSSGTLDCSTFGDYVACLNEKFLTCDGHESLDKKNLTADMETTYSLSCTGHVATCPGVLACLSMLPTDTGSSSGNPLTAENILQICSLIPPMLTCMDTELGKCNVPGQRSYGFSDLADDYTSACQVLETNTGLQTCPGMNQCVSSMNISTDPQTIYSLVFDPQFWCSILRSELYCANANLDCANAPAQVTSAFAAAQQQCPDAPLFVSPPRDTTPGRGNVVRTTPTTSGSERLAGGALLLLVSVFICHMSAA